METIYTITIKDTTVKLVKFNDSHYEIISTVIGGKADNIKDANTIYNLIVNEIKDRN